MDARNAQTERAFWRRHANVALGATWLTVGCLVAFGQRFATTAGLDTLYVLAGIMFAAAGCFWALTRTTRSSGRRLGVFVVWSAFTIVLVVVAIGVNGGTVSPIHPLIFMALVFPALAYPWRQVLALSVLTFGGAAFTVLTADGDPRLEFFFVMSLGITGGMVTIAAHNRGTLQDAYEQVTRRLEDEALHDGLTGCLNRRGFDQALEHEVHRAIRYRRPLSLLAVDLDHLKAINDTGGHAAGDRAIREVAAALEGVAREVDVVGRPGGDEFAMLLPETGPQEAERLARRIHARLGPALDIPITVSIGVAALSTGAVTLDEEGLRSAADTALFVAKARGRNRTAVIPTASQPAVGGDRAG